MHTFARIVPTAAAVERWRSGSSPPFRWPTRSRRRPGRRHWRPVPTKPQNTVLSMLTAHMSTLCCMRFQRGTRCTNSPKAVCVWNGGSSPVGRSIGTPSTIAVAAPATIPIGSIALADFVVVVAVAVGLGVVGSAAAVVVLVDRWRWFVVAGRGICSIDHHRRHCSSYPSCCSNLLMKNIILKKCNGKVF